MEVGVTLAKRDRQAASHLAESWTFSPEIGGTPGRDNFAKPGDFITDAVIGDSAAVKALVPTNGNLGLSWTQTGFDDASMDAAARRASASTRVALSRHRSA